MVAGLMIKLSAAHPVQNPVQLENERAGTGDWQLDNSANNQEIEGYANLTSVERGGQISFYVNTQDSSYTIQVFRMGWYGGLGGRQETQPVTLPGIAQPMPPPDPDHGRGRVQLGQPIYPDVNNPRTRPTG